MVGRAGFGRGSDRIMIDKARIHRLSASPVVQLIAFVALALALRCATFGDLNRHADETFYFLVGQRMHEGALPYVDVWDRKPLGLFLIYYLLAGISRSVLSYQIAACVLAGVAATLLSALVSRWSNVRGAWFAGGAYLLTLGSFEGATGQTPDFYNPLIAGAVLLLLLDADRRTGAQVGWRGWMAMFLCGLAITIKQTTLFESAFLGGYLLFGLRRAGASWQGLIGDAFRCCVLGAAPTLAICAFYLAVGHWPEFWQAMVMSNFSKALEGGLGWRLASIAVNVAPLAVLAALGLLLPTVSRQGRAFVSAWTGAAFVGFCAVPNFYGHYLLPMLMPLCVSAGFLLGHIRHWRPVALAYTIYINLWYNVSDRAVTLENNRAMREMASLIRKHDPGGGLLVFDGPVYLYALADRPFLSPLVFPQHLNHGIEHNVSHLDTDREIDRIVAAGPGVIVMSRFPRSHPVNAYARAKFLAYARSHCRVVKVEVMPKGSFKDYFVIFGDCARRRSAA